MGLFLANGTRRTKSTVSKSNETDPLQVLGEDLYETVQYNAGANGSVISDLNPAGGSLKKLWKKAGSVVRQSEIDAKFPTAVISSVSPSAAAAAGGTTITLTGTDLDGVTGVTLGGTACTSVTVVNQTKVTCVTPAKAAGTYDVVATDDSGTITKTNAVTTS